jgi:NAD(P)-dependent dehydrogenase (short-subunit alcohol dehydrogenase family)
MYVPMSIIGLQPAVTMVVPVTLSACSLCRIVAKRWPDAGIDVLINNAGLARNNASLFDGATSSWLEMLSTNVLGNCMCTREVLQVGVCAAGKDERVSCCKAWHQKKVTGWSGHLQTCSSTECSS